MSIKLYIVVPCYNEEAVLGETAGRLLAKICGLIDAGRIDGGSRILFVNDGSSDGTWAIIRRLYEDSPVFAGLNLARNRGHQNALLAGLLFAMERADAAISMDADLQDDIEAIDEMLEQHAAGFDIVYGVRSGRAQDSWFKRRSAEGFYRIMRAMGVDLVYNHADFRLMSRRALVGLSQFGEANLFLRGIVPMIGYPSAIVRYERLTRFAGETKYPLKKMLGFALEGVTSLSVRPIRIITVIGILSFVASLIMLIYFIADYFRGGTTAGWASLIVSIWAIGGLQLLAIGIIGEYIGKTYLEVKARPRYIIDEELHRD